MLVTDRIFWRWYLFFVIVCSGWYLNNWQNNTGTWFFLVLANALLALLTLVLFNKINLTRFHDQTIKLPEWLILLFSGLLVCIPSFLTFLYPTQIVFHESGKLLLLLWVSGLGVWLLQNSKRKRLASLNFLLLLLVGGVLYKIGTFVPDVQSAPFSLGWSEGSRYFDASLFSSSTIYGDSFPLPVLHPSRYLLQSIPFLLGSQSIVIHRFWQVMLWLVLVGLGSYSLVKRINPANKFIAWVLGLWLFLFFFQGAVYYHLMVCVILVLIGYNLKRPWQTMAFVLIASIWAGLSRVNWVPVPALLAVTLYLLETPAKSTHWLKYLKNPLLWCLVGGISALVTNRIYAFLSGNTVEQFSSSFTSYMIWSRLLPNTTYKPGIILGSLIVFLPLALLMIQQIVNNGLHRYYHWIRTLGLLGILAVFGLGGVIVSVKIGGGGDLHNLDAFLVFWVLITSMIVIDRYAFELDQPSVQSKMNYGLLLLVVVVPVILTFQKNTTWTFQDVSSQKNDVAHLQLAVDLITEDNGDVLFITERQLLTFGDIQDVELVPDYEKVFLMEMVMSNNTPYLDDFHQKLAAQEFSAIVLDSISTITQNEKDSFWVENNLWVDKVVYPVLDYYEPVFVFQNNNINLLIPKGQPDLYDQLMELKSW
ncbi:MAG: hypothetical protein CVU41_15615 [Chloroflexi bacterium HGW-Chloroflexi-3]|nr:MAG: hypothetical protein CVU41_15615 [Chloroflexi bacterium HGW-Chloroflexi-3]